MSDNILIKLKATADVLGGEVFFATENGTDPEYPNNGELLPNGLYIRLNGSDGSLAYISAFALNNVINNINANIAVKANQVDINTLQNLLESKATDTDIALLKADIDTKAELSTVTNLSNVVADKVNKTEFETLSNVVDIKANISTVDALIEIVNSKASLKDVNNIVKDIKVLQNALATITDPNIINVINSQINNLSSELKKCLTADDLIAINNKFNQISNADANINERISEIENNLNKKASTVYVQGQVNDLNNTINNVIESVNAKANKADVAVKTNKSDFDSLVKKVTNLNTKVSSLDYDFNTKVSEFNSSISSKVNKTNYDKTIEDINNQLLNKTDNAVFTDTINKLTSRLTTLDDKHKSDNSILATDIDELECEFENIVSELRNLAESQNNKIKNHETAINDIKSIATQNTDKLKQSWVRVLSTNEYKNLNKLTDDITIYNPRYKYPNTVYLVVDFNVPKAIYIGDILIAKAEQTGPAGFSYNFPIIF